MISCRDWWSWKKPGYITMTRRKSNNLWSGDIAAHPAPKNSEYKNPLQKFSPLFDFLWSRRHPSIDYLPKGQIINAEYYLSLMVQLKDILKDKRRWKITKVSCSCMTLPRFTGHFQPRRNWPIRTSSILIIHTLLRIWPRRTTTCTPGLKKNNWKSSFFVRRGSHCCRGDLVGRTKFWFFFEWLAKVRATS